jgi:uncharacterized protein
MAAKFELSKDKAGEFRFHLNAANGEIIAASQRYATKGERREGHRVGEGERSQRRSGRPHRVVASKGHTAVNCRARDGRAAEP